MPRKNKNGGFSEDTDSQVSDADNTKDTGNAALKKLRSVLNVSEPVSDFEKRKQLSPGLSSVERLHLESQNYQNDEHTDIDTEIPPEGVGTPFNGGTSKKYPTELLEQGYDREESWVIKHYIPQNSFGMVYGPSESFKSFHAVCWAACIASGTSWNGIQCDSAPVLYIAAEGGYGASKRAQGWKLVNNDGQPLDWLHAIKMPVFIGSPTDVNEIVNTIMTLNNQMEEKISVVFIDTLARCFGGADENKTSDMNMFVAGCDKIRVETGVTVIVIHHTGKNKDREARGSSALRGACDFEYCIDRPDKGMHYVLTCKKVKDSEPPPKEAFDMSRRFLRYDSDGEEVTTLVASLKGYPAPDENEDNAKPQTLSKNQEALWQAIRSRMASGESTTVALVRDDLKSQGMAISNFSKWLDALIHKGLVRLDGDELVVVNQG